MIEFTKSYKTADGQVFGSIEEAQKHEVKAALNLSTDGGNTPDTIAAIIMDKKDILVDILTMTPNSKPKARKMHGGTKNRKKTVITDAATSVLAQVNTSDLCSGTHNS